MSGISEWAQRIRIWLMKGQSGLVVLLGVLLIAGLWLYSWQKISDDYDRSIEESSQETMNLARAFEEHVRRVVSDADKDLLALKWDYEKNGISSQVFASLKESSLTDPSKKVVSIFNEQGKIIQSSIAVDLTLDRSDRDYFRVHRESANKDLYISKPIIGRSSGNSVIPLTRRITKADGSFGGIVYISLSIDYFVEFYNKINLGPDQLISISGMDGFSRARRVDDKVTSGEDVRGSEFWRNIQNGRYDATFIAAAPFDGVTRVTSYRVMSDYPLIVTVGKSIQAVLAGHEQRKQDTIIGALLISSFILLFCVFLIQRNEKTLKLTTAVQQEKDRLSSLVDSMSDEVWFADTGKQFTMMNRAAAREFCVGQGGVSVEALADSLEVLRADGSPRPVDEAPSLRALRGEIIHDEEEIIRAPLSGELRYREVNANPVRDAAGTIIGSVTVVRDITERKQEEVELAKLYQKAEEGSRAKSEFLANMSHELRTPLNSIIGFAEVLKDQLFGRLNMKQDKYVENILVSAQHLLALITDILDLSKVEAGKMELEISQVNISGICRNSVALFKDKAAKRQIRLSFAPDPEVDDLILFADERKIKQILFNLIGNGIKYNKPGGSLSVLVDKVDKEDAPSAIRIVVEDTGIGINSEGLLKLFKPFVQLSRVHTEPAEGTGLGLVLTKYLVELHGGEIHVESVFGEGSRFTVLLPMREKRNGMI